MFQQDQKKSWVEAGLDQVAYLATSVNRPVVVPPGRSPEPAQAYVCILRTAKGYEFYIYLHLITSNLGLLYKWDKGAMPKEVVPQIQQSATEFTESMGFMMNDLRWREMNPAQKQDSFNSFPIFFQDLSRFQEQSEEEVLEIEPVAEEIVVERVEEPVHTVTEGDFIIQEDTFAEPRPREAIFDEEVAPLPEESAPGSAPLEPGPPLSEEDLLLENLEAKEEPVSGMASGTGAKGKAPELLIEIDETPEPKERISIEPEPAVSVAPPQVEVAWEKDLAEAQPEVMPEPEIAISIETEGPPIQEPTPQPVMEVEEISFQETAEPEPQSAGPESGPAPILEPEPDLAVSPSGPEEIPARPEIVASEVVAAEEEKPAGEGQLDPEELKLIVRFLAMF